VVLCNKCSWKWSKSEMICSFLTCFVGTKESPFERIRISSELSLAGSRIITVDLFVGSSCKGIC